MPEVKASGILTIKKILEARGPEAEAVFTAALSAESLKVYRLAVAPSWIPFAAEAEIFEKASETLFPENPQRLRRLGYEVAKIQFKGLYKVFLLMTTVDYVVKRTAQIWGTIYNSGSARVEDVNDYGGTLIAQDLPDQLPTQREYICGYLIGLLEMTNVRNVRVRKDESNPRAWKWIFTWEKKK